ncbi:tRNA nucleotidyltransferase/poly(A) polymerase family protein [Necator americanus]|uniref:tRNA nucleotidyltransferase/poly(A) polymerase family protein n=1 Tax=Necator americanus TaxID=51031 RepID=W2TTF8_NECAM|nr:tRNA nucleotidyltransferase/poly(A) polymerase family protein [Necator americanus]ETN84332.1 tRNA nucleotidyltransferase/poly(A) polymerase family protein [Necator americanus]
MILKSLVQKFSSSFIRPVLAKNRINPRKMKIDTPEFRSLFTPQLNKLSELFKENNYDLRIAGGAVRDLLMGIRPADVDFATTATPTQMKELFDKEQIRMLHKRGEEHGTITCRMDDKENFEITTLRYFRFFGRISSSAEHECETIKAIKENSEGLAGVSAERIWTEMKRLVIGRMADHVIRCMLDECKLQKYLGLPEDTNVDRFARVFRKYEMHLEPMTMIASLCETPEDIDRFHKKTKLSNVERILGEFIVGYRKSAEHALSTGALDWWKDVIVQLEVTPGHDKQKVSGLYQVVQLARAVCADEKLIKELESWTIPIFPVKGLDLMAVGVERGPKMKLTLTYLFELWQKSRYEMSKEELLTHAHDSCIPNPQSPTSLPKKRRREESW